MKTLKTILCAAVCVAALGFGTANVQAQGRGNFDPAQYRQSRIDRYKSEMAVTDDAEWKLIGDAIGKVMDAQQALMADRIRGFFGGGRRSRGGSSSTDSTSSSSSSRSSRFGTPSPEAEALQKAIDSNAPADEIKAKLATLRAANATKEAALNKAQDDLKALLTSRQEAIAVMGGLLK